MRLVIQRVSHASVSVNDEVVGKIDCGLMVLVGVTHDDDLTKAEWLAHKLVNMRIFSDLEDKMNLSIRDVAGKVLAISQFTLYGESVKGNRPSFIEAARPEIAKPIYEHFMLKITEYGVDVESGVFGADMQVSLTNDGPVTILLER